jgi:copper chaperone CopZ
VATLLIRIRDLDPGRAGDIEDLLRTQPGVFGAVFSHSEGCVEVDFEDDEVDVDALLDRVRDAGYDARLSG